MNLNGRQYFVGFFSKLHLFLCRTCDTIKQVFCLIYVCHFLDNKWCNGQWYGLNICKNYLHASYPRFKNILREYMARAVFTIPEFGYISRTKLASHWKRWWDCDGCLSQTVDFFDLSFQRYNCGVLWDRNSVQVQIRIFSKFSKIVWKNFIIKHFDENLYALSIPFLDNDIMYIASQIKRNRIYICYTLI